MVTSRSWRSNNSNNSEEQAPHRIPFQNAFSLLNQSTAMPNQLSRQARGPSDAPMLVSAPTTTMTAANSIDNDTAVRLMSMGHMQQQVNRLLMQQQQQQAQQQTLYQHLQQAQQQPSHPHHNHSRRYSPSSGTAAISSSSSSHSAAAAAALSMPAGMSAASSRRMAPTPAPAHRPGMKDVPYWLKTLRLHKYTAMFGDMEYVQMMALDEAELEIRGVTKGARRKILQSIAKLKQRATNVRRLEATFDVVESACLRCAIVELRQLVATPILQYAPGPARSESEEEIDGVCAIDAIPDENLPALMVRLLMRVYALGVAGDAPHEQVKPELLLMYFTICDRMLMNEAFTSSQKRRIVQWRRAARRFAAPAELRRIVLPHPPPPRCDACTPVSTFYFNDSLEDILRVQNLQRLVKQYLNSSESGLPAAAVASPYYDHQAAHAAALQAATAAAARSQLQRDAALCGFSATAAYAARPSALARKLMPRGGPVSTPPPSFYGAPVQQQTAHTAARMLQQHQQAAAARCCPAALQAAFQQQQQTAAAMRMAAANAAAAAAAAATAQFGWEGVYSSSDVLELTRPLDLDFTAEAAGISRAAASSMWSNTPASSTSEEASTAGDSGTSGYSSGSSERGSGAGSPRAAETAGAPAPQSPNAGATAAAFPAPGIVFDFSRNVVEDSSLDAACRQIQEQLSFRP
ncbi:hypothetical protein PFISCL1PPCAC_2849 [Pristionchus fissidentatus]|uniref:SAM domain-containing protein n=1 Tax=Pristionchus fissidentatus TaxID=1538716 RepID=A0AAV5UYA1_9BILA|nr:hypothetical protein PFISCL1PPCAC_2849 [Pristionchus fissidentatus]